MRNCLILAIIFFLAVKSQAQELFVATEPASNAPKNSMRVRLTNEGLLETDAKSRTTLGVMYGLTKNIMVNANAYSSDFYQRKQQLTGYSFYGKYRFLNLDQEHRHFRGAFFAHFSSVKFPVIHDEINLAGENNAVQTGLIFTQLLNKLAVSASGSYTRSLDKFISGHEMLHDYTRNSFYYTVSSGYLLFPKSYSNYKQLNVNTYLEFLGDSHLGSGRKFLEAAPSVQLIFNSKLRVDLSKRVQLLGNMQRRFLNLYQIRAEYNIFNIF